MIFSTLPGRTPTWKPLALVSAVTLCTLNPAIAQTHDDKTLTPVVVTASRFANDPALAPIGATVITAEDIRSAGVDNVNQAIRKIGGVYGRQSSYGTQDFDLDLRGFGTNSSQNLVVLVDGVRLSENELSVAQLSSIPIDTVERIEIVRGGSSVLYGDGATGGVIQIITKRPQLNATHGSVTAEVGQFNHKTVRASVAKGWEGFSLDANVSKLESDNYRDNNAVDQENFSGGAQWASNEGRIGMRVDIARQDSRLAGPLSLDKFEQNPRKTSSPDDFASTDTNRYTAFIERKLGAWEVAAELSHRERTSKAMYGAYALQFDGRMTQFSPRIRHLTASGSLTNEFVLGMDFAHWTRSANSNYNGDPFPQVDGSQQSKALYARNEIKVGEARLALGARHEIFDKDSVENGVGLYDVSQALNAWELQGSYAATPLLNLFAKTGQSYRVANVDENGSTQVDNQPLNPQISHDLELGATLGSAVRKITAKLFQHRLKNEIFYDQTIDANVNLDPTKRQGIEIEASTRLATAFTLSANLQHVSAKFTEGPNAGNEMVMVPKNIVSVRLNWLPADGQSADIGAQWVDSQRYGGDFENNCLARIPSFVTLDGRYAKRVGAWEFAITGSNLTDKHYYSNAYSCKPGISGIYPGAGRQLKLSARYDF